MSIHLGDCLQGRGNVIRIKKHIITLLFLYPGLLISRDFSQNIKMPELVPLTINGMQVSGSFNFLTPLDDAFLAVEMGLYSVKNDFSLALSFAFRPSPRKIRVKRSNRFYYQFNEERYIATILAGKLIHLNSHFWGELTGGAGLQFGKYQGTSLAVEQKNEIQPIAGLNLLYRRDKFHVKLGYQYLALPNSGDHHIFIGLGANVQKYKWGGDS